jgi:hypothetical protein
VPSWQDPRVDPKDAGPPTARVNVELPKVIEVDEELRRAPRLIRGRQQTPLIAIHVAKPEGISHIVPSDPPEEFAGAVSIGSHHACVGRPSVGVQIVQPCLRAKQGAQPDRRGVGLVHQVADQRDCGNQLAVFVSVGDKRGMILARALAALIPFAPSRLWGRDSINSGCHCFQTFNVASPTLKNSASRASVYPSLDLLSPLLGLPILEPKDLSTHIGWVILRVRGIDRQIVFPSLQKILTACGFLYPMARSNMLAAT